MLAAIVAAVLAISQSDLVTDDVDLISVAHVQDRGSVVCFWGRAAGNWHLLAHRWSPDEASISRQANSWAFNFRDTQDECWRVVRAPQYIESWESGDPINESGLWFVQLLEPGLRQPKQAK